MRDAELLGLSIEIQCQLAFTQLNIVLSKPITQDSKYDFIADINNKLLKIQCKSCIAESDESAITFHTCSCGRGAGGKNYSHTYSADDVDYFYTYYKGKSYLIPIEEIGSTSKTLRFSAKENHPTINWATNYELTTILLKKENYSFNNNFLDNHKKDNLNHCIDCGAIISINAIRCQSCDHKRAQIIERPEREALKSMIKNKPFTEIGKQYGVSDNAIRKWCKAVGLPASKKEINQYTDLEWEKI